MEEYFNKAEFLYNIAVSHEKPMENPDDITLSIQNMLAEIRELGYGEFCYLADVKLRRIKEPSIMKILLKYYDEMDLFTRDNFMYKIHPQKFPEIVQIAKEEFLKLGPMDRMTLNGFQIAMSKAKVTDAYLDEMFELLERAENYPYLFAVRKRMCKNFAHRMSPLLDRYSDSVLLLSVIEDMQYIMPSDDVVEKLTNWANIAEDEIEALHASKSNEELSVTTYKYFRNLCTPKRIRSDAKRVLKKLKNEKAFKD